MKLTLDWLKNLPKIESVRRNFFDIAGYPSWENVNSNILAFYLDEREDHLMERLFFDSLLEILEENRDSFKLPDLELFAVEYTVEREVNFIDLLIQSEPENGTVSWAILIENKINHHLHNPLNKYWASVNAANKIGVVLTLQPLSDNEIINRGGDGKFINITHSRLTNQIRKNLSLHFDKADDRHLLFLKEYFANIESHQKMEQPNSDKEKMLSEIQKHKKDIEYLNSSIDKLRLYVMERIAHVMDKYGFEPKNTYQSRSKTYYSKNEQPKNGVGNLRFWVDIELLLMDNEFHIYFEVVGDGFQYGEELQEYLKEKFHHWSHLIEPGARRSSVTTCHLASSKKPITTEPLDQALEERVKLFFEGKENSIVGLSTQKLQQLIKEKSIPVS